MNQLSKKNYYLLKIGLVSLTLLLIILSLVGGWPATWEALKIVGYLVLALIAAAFAAFPEANITTLKTQNGHKD
jgi:hypothetical protein